MLGKRIIPCLDVKDGRTVKGTRFTNLRDAGDPVELALAYCRQGADEIVFLDITATNEKRKTRNTMVSAVAAAIDIPFTVGGGIASIADIESLLMAGADKISINSAAFHDRTIVAEAAKRFGSQSIVLAIDAKRLGRSWAAHSNGGRRWTAIDAIEWAKRGADEGAGEILLTSIDADGTKNGFDTELTRSVADEVPVPVIASGGAGRVGHFQDVFEEGRADAALAASVFHFREIAIPELKRFLDRAQIPVRI